MKIRKMWDIDYEIEMPLSIYNVYLGYINQMVAVTDDRNSYKELARMLPGEYTDEELEKWFYQTMAHVAAMKLKRYENE